MPARPTTDTLIVREVESPLGRLRLIFEEVGLCELHFEGNVSPSSPPQAEEGRSNLWFVEETVRRLRRYFAGERVSFEDLPVSFSRGTDFERRVWSELRKVPHGRLITYGELATRIGAPAASRAVGRALAANPVPIVVPCHRVVRKGGGLGGFSAGLEKKRALLELEKAL
jgi:methylated-DNA-[protein]-cysteine S-methyltransferase